MLFTVATVIVLVSVSVPIHVESADAGIYRETVDREVPAVVSGENVYLAWWTNNTENGNEEVMFRASTDGGPTFTDKIDLSNTTDADSWRVEIAGEGETVVVSWWETNQTSDIPVAKISTDAGETFGPSMMLAANGMIIASEQGKYYKDM
jgi:hypothetical protein